MNNRAISIVTAAALLAGLAACKPTEPSPQNSSAAATTSAPVDCATRRAQFDDGGRIVGGEDAPPGSAPWQIEIFSTLEFTAADRAFDKTLADGDKCKTYLDTRKDFEFAHQCGGSYIGDGWVITAAHCVDQVKNANVPTYLKVRMGTQNLTVTSGTFAIDSIVTHKDYTRKPLQTDIALIKVKDDGRIAGLIAAKKLAAIDLMQPNDRAFETDEILRVTGWGWMGEREPGVAVTGFDSQNQLQRSPAQLQQISLNYLGDERCGKELGTRYGPDLICAALLGADDAIKMGADRAIEKGKDICQGDSGGPLTRAADGGGRTLVGIVSGGKGCGAGRAAVFTRVSRYDQWITAAKESAVSGKVTSH